MNLENFININPNLYSFKGTLIRYESSIHIRKDSGKMWFPKCKNSEPSDFDLSSNSTISNSNNNKFNSLQSYLGSDFNTENGAVIIRMVDTEGYNHFTRFEMFDKLMHLMNRIEDRFRNFHEVILGNYSQKLRFDIDFDYNSDSDPNLELYKSYEVLVSCIQACYNVLANPHSHANTINLLEYPQSVENFDVYIINLFEFIDKHVIVCTSNRHFKCSYHVIIDGFYALNSIHVKAVADMIISRIPEHFKHYIDSGVYKSFQHLRVLGGTKQYILPDGRKKFSVLEYVRNIPDICELVLKNNFKDLFDKFPKEFKYKKYDSVEYYCKKENYYHLFKNSLISFTIGCKPLNYVPEKKTYAITKIPKHIIEEAIKQFKKYLSENSLDFKFLISGVKDGIVTIRRLRPSLCPICSRIHDSENPYIYVLERKKLEGIVNLSDYYFYYNCRRHDNTVKNLKFGVVSSKIGLEQYKNYFSTELLENKNTEWTIQDINENINSDVIVDKLMFESSDDENNLESVGKLSKLIELQLLKELELEELEKIKDKDKDNNNNNNKKVNVSELVLKSELGLKSELENLVLLDSKEKKSEVSEKKVSKPVKLKMKPPKFIVRQENMMDY